MSHKEIWEYCTAKEKKRDKRQRAVVENEKKQTNITDMRTEGQIMKREIKKDKRKCT